MYIISTIWVLLLLCFTFLISKDVFAERLEGKAFNSKSLFKVFRIYPKTWENIRSLAQLRLISEEKEVLLYF